MQHGALAAVLLDPGAPVGARHPLLDRGDQPAGVAEGLPRRHPADRAGRGELGQVRADRGVEVEPPVGRQLLHEQRRHRLGQRGDGERGVRGDGQAAPGHPLPGLDGDEAAPVAHGELCARHPVRTRQLGEPGGQELPADGRGPGVLRCVGRRLLRGGGLPGSSGLRGSGLRGSGLRRRGHRDPRQALDGRVREQVLRHQVPAGPPGPVDHLDAQHRVPAEVEEVAGHVDGVDRAAEHVRPDRGQCGLRPVTRGDPGRVGVGHRARGGQRPPVDLAAGRQREHVQLHEERGHHVRRQLPCEVRLQLRGGGTGLPVTRPLASGAGGRHEVGRQVLVAGPVLARHHDGRADLGVGVQHRLDLAELDPESADLDLVVGAADELQDAVGPPADHVAGAVHALPGRPERVGHEAAGGQVGAVGVAARHAFTGDVQLTRHAGRDRLEAGVEHVHPGVGDRPADRRRTGGAAGQLRGGRPDRGLGRPVHVGHRRRSGGQGLGQLRGQRLAADEHPDPGEHVGSALGHAAPQARRRLHHRDALGVDHPAQLLRVVHQLLVGQHHGRAADQRHEQFQVRDVEPDGGDGQQPVLGGHRGAVPHVQHEVAQVAAGDHDALGLAGGTGGVERVGGVVRARRRGRFRLGGRAGRQCGDHLGVGEREGGRALGQVEYGRVAGQGQHRGRVLQHEREALARVVQVQRQVGRARLQHRQHGHQQFGRARAGQGDDLFGAQPLRHQVVGEPVRAGVQLGVADPGVAVHQCGALRGGRGLLFEQLDGGGRPGLPGGGVPLVQQDGPLAGGQHGQPADRGLRVVGEGVQQGRQAFGDPLHGVRVEQARVVAEAQVQFVGGVGGERERVVGLLRAVALAHHEAVPGGRVAVVREALEDDDAVEQVRAPRDLAPAAHLCQRHVLELPGLDLLVLHPLQPGHQVEAAVHGGPYGQRVDEQADDLVRARQFRGAAGHRRAEAHVALAAVPREQQRPRALHDAVHRQPGALGELVEPARAFGGQPQVHVARGARVVRGRRHPVERQRGGRREARHGAAPVRLGGGVVLLGQPLHVVPVRAARLRRRGGRAAERGVLLEHLGQRVGEAPPVEQQVVGGPEDLDALRRQPGDGQPHERRLGQVDLQRGQALPQRPRPRVLLLLGEAAPVQVRHGQPHVAADDLERDVHVGPDHGGAQDRGAVHDALERVGEALRVVHAVQHRAEVREVHVAVAAERVEQHAALHRGERVDVLHRAAVAGDPVHRRLVQPGQREVGRGAPAGAGQGAVLDDLLQRREERLGQPGDRLLAVNVP